MGSKRTLKRRRQRFRTKTRRLLPPRPPHPRLEWLDLDQVIKDTYKQQLLDRLFASDSLLYQKLRKKAP
jgi:hypothetical protein